MSFDINWDQLVGDGSINESIKQFLDKQFSNLELPSYINNLSVSNFSLGTNPPEITIRHIGDPFDEFYEDEDEEGDDLGKNDLINHGLVYKDFDVDDHSESESESDEEDKDLSDVEDRDIRSNTTMGGPGDIHRENGNGSGVTLSLLNGLHHHNYGINSVGINTRSETPTILSQHPYSNPLLTNFNNNNNNNKRNNKSESDADKKRNDVPSSSTNSTPGPGPAKSDSDIQFIAEVKYEGDLHLEINVNLLVNYPSPNFITLPINLHVTDLNIHSIMAIAYLKKSVFLTFLCDIDEISVDYFNTNHNTGGNFVDYVSGSQQERIDIIKRVRIESEIGEVEQNVLRNVGKVEKFLVEQLRSILRDEVAWPSWVCVDLNGEDDE